MGKRLAQALVYGAFGSVFVPLAGAILSLPALLLYFGISFLPALSGLFFSEPLLVMSWRFVNYSNSTSLSGWAIPAFGALIFALGGALMRPDGDKKFDDIRLLPRFYREVFIWMLRGALFCAVWGTILGAISTGKTDGYFSGAAVGVLAGTLCGEVLGLLIGATRGALLREREA